MWYALDIDEQSEAQDDDFRSPSNTLSNSDSSSLRRDESFTLAVLEQFIIVRFYYFKFLFIYYLFIYLFIYLSKKSVDEAIGQLRHWGASIWKIDGIEDGDDLDAQITETDNMDQDDEDDDDDDDNDGQQPKDKAKAKANNKANEKVSASAVSSVPKWDTDAEGIDAICAVQVLPLIKLVRKNLKKLQRSLCGSFPFIYLRIYMYVYMYVCMCVCMCMCVYNNETVEYKKIWRMRWKMDLIAIWKKRSL